MTIPAAEALYLTGGPWPLFAWLHRPAAGRRLGMAVLCPPLLGEHSAAYHLYRSVAIALASAGITVVRFDYEGTGDSAGPSGGPGRVLAWLDGVDQAAALARCHADGPLALVGVRSGALVAAKAAERRKDVDALVLWDPWLAGRPFLRRLRALQAMQSPAPQSPAPIASDGIGIAAVELPGYRVDADVAADLAGLRLPSTLAVRRALVLARPGRTPGPIPLATRAGGSAARAVAEVVLLEPGEQEALFESGPLDRRLPAGAAATAVGWLTRTLRHQAGSLPGTTRRPVPVPPGCVAGAPVAVTTSAVGEATVYEQPVRLGRRGLFAVDTRPRPAPSGWPTVVFLTSGTEPHVGPSRLWVQLARRWASQGVRCVRVDLSGWGDSEPRPGRQGQVLRTAEAFDDVRDVVEAVGGARSTVLVGLCSGAYQALESALELSPLGVLAVNPLLRFTPPELAAGRPFSDRRRICDPRAPWVAGVRAKVPSAVAAALVSLRHATRRLGGTTSGSWLDRLEASGVHVYCVCGEAELRQLPKPTVRATEAATVDPSPRARVDFIPGLDHALLSVAQQEEVVVRLSDQLQRIVDRAGAPGEPLGAAVSRVDPQVAVRAIAQGRAER